jgi:hypothetical protein
MSRLDQILMCTVCGSLLTYLDAYSKIVVINGEQYAWEYFNMMTEKEFELFLEELRLLCIFT